MVFSETAVKLCPAPCEAACERRDIDEAVGHKPAGEDGGRATPKKKEPLRLNVPQKQPEPSR
jgi:hypothetical protein